jgi:hypothetical protein
MADNSPVECRATWRDGGRSTEQKRGEAVAPIPPERPLRLSPSVVGNPVRCSGCKSIARPDGPSLRRSNLAYNSCHATHGHKRTAAHLHGDVHALSKDNQNTRQIRIASHLITASYTAMSTVAVCGFNEVGRYH